MISSYGGISNLSEFAAKNQYKTCNVVYMKGTLRNFFINEKKLPQLGKNTFLPTAHSGHKKR
jgi:hypothetical protein